MNTPYRRTAVLLASLLLAVTHAASARADESETGFMVGKVRVKPKITVEGSQDSNIFLQSYSAQSAYILNAGPALGFSAAGPRMNLDAGYEFRQLVYSRFQSVNNAQHHTGALSYTWDYISNGQIGIDDLFVATTDPATSELVARTKRNQNDFGANLEAPLGGKSFVGLRIRSILVDYQTTLLSNLLDRNETNAGIRAGWAPTPKTKLYLYGRRAQIDYKVNTLDNSTGMTAGIGVEGDLTSRITGTLEVGNLTRKYSHTLSGQPEKFSTARYSARIEWQAPAEFQVVLSALRAPMESIFRRYYLTNGGTLSIEKPLGRSFAFQVLGGFERDLYPGDITGYSSFITTKRVDDLTAFGASLTYMLFEHQKLTLKYLNRNRTSNLAGFGYKDGVATLGGEYLF